MLRLCSVFNLQLWCEVVVKFPAGEGGLRDGLNVYFGRTGGTCNSVLVSRDICLFSHSILMHPYPKLCNCGVVAEWI